MELRQYPGYVGTHTPRTRLRFMTVGAVRLALHHRGGWLEVLRTGPLPRYAPHLGKDEEGWPHGLWLRDDLLAWAHDNL